MGGRGKLTSRAMRLVIFACGFSSYFGLLSLGGGGGWEGGINYDDANENVAASCCCCYVECDTDPQQQQKIAVLRRFCTDTKQKL